MYVSGQSAMELATGADAELGEDLAQVVLDGARADEQPGADLRIGQAVAGQPRDLRLLGGQRRTGPAARAGAAAGARGHGLAGGRQLAPGPLGESLHAHVVEHLVGGAQLLARFTAAALAAQPPAVPQLRGDQLGTAVRAGAPAGRLAGVVPRR